jgi:hypothetical protein
MEHIHSLGIRRVLVLDASVSDTDTYNLHWIISNFLKLLIKVSDTYT